MKKIIFASLLFSVFSCSKTDLPAVNPSGSQASPMSTMPPQDVALSYTRPLVNGTVAVFKTRADYDAYKADVFADKMNVTGTYIKKATTTTTTTSKISTNVGEAPGGAAGGGGTSPLPGNYDAQWTVILNSWIFLNGWEEHFTFGYDPWGKLHVANFDQFLVGFLGGLTTGKATTSYTVNAAQTIVYFTTSQVQTLRGEIGGVVIMDYSQTFVTKGWYNVQNGTYYVSRFKQSASGIQ